MTRELRAREGGAPRATADEGRSRARGLLSAAALVGALSILSSLLGFVRDLAIARYFGATAQTDAFIVAWTIPETAAPLLMEGALSSLLVSVFSYELVHRRRDRDAVSGVLGPLLLALAAVSALIAVAAPVIVTVLSPGLADPHLAARMVRAAAVTVFLFGVAGYLMAALRARDRFGWSGSVYVAYNVGIIGAIVALHGRLGILSAALGLVVGGCCMVLVQLPAFLRGFGLPRLGLRLPRELLGRLGQFLPLVLYTLGRQAQVYVERFVGSLLAVGSISHLNYAQKIGQIPMQLTLTMVLVTLPALSRAAAASDLGRVRELMERVCRASVFLIVPATALFVAFGHDIVVILFQRGAFGPADSAATARILEVYSLGLLGQVLVGVSVQAYIAIGRTTEPARAAVVALLATAVVAAAAAPLIAAPGIALANAVGISLMALLLVRDLSRRGVGARLGPLAAHLGRCLAAVAVAVAAGLGARAVYAQVASAPGPGDVAALAVGVLALVLVYWALARLLRVPEASEVVDRSRAAWARLRGASPV